MAECVIFDMDGVILDIQHIYLYVKTDILNEEGYDVDITYQYQFMGLTFDDMWNKMKSELNLPKPIEYYKSEVIRRRDATFAKEGRRPIKGVLNFINDLYDNNFLLAVASSSPKQDIIDTLSEFEVLEKFDLIISGEEIKQSKPHPDIYLTVANRLGLTADSCVVIEDSTIGIQAAKEAGMYCIAYANPEYPVNDLSLADTQIRCFSELNAQNIKNIH